MTSKEPALNDNGNGRSAVIAELIKFMLSVIVAAAVGTATSIAYLHSTFATKADVIRVEAKVNDLDNSMTIHREQDMQRDSTAKADIEALKNVKSK